MSVPFWLLCNTASFLPQLLTGKVLLKKFHHHDSLKRVLIFITISFLCQNVCFLSMFAIEKFKYACFMKLNGIIAVLIEHKVVPRLRTMLGICIFFIKIK